MFCPLLSGNKFKLWYSALKTGINHFTPECLNTFCIWNSIDTYRKKCLSAYYIQWHIYSIRFTCTLLVISNLMRNQINSYHGQWQESTLITLHNRVDPASCERSEKVRIFCTPWPTWHWFACRRGFLGQPVRVDLHYQGAFFGVESSVAHTFMLT